MTSQPLRDDDSAPWQAPDFTLTRDDGAEVRLSSLWEQRPLVLVFFGDLANPFTGDHAAQLRDADEAFARADADIAAIVTSEPEQSLAYRHYWLLPYPLLSDPERRAYDAFSVKPNTSATFIVAKDGLVTYARHAGNLADYPPSSALIAAVCDVTGAEPPAPPPVLALPQDEPLTRIEDGRLVTVDQFACAKCGYDACQRSEIATAGGFLSRIFNFQHRKFVAVSCNACGYTELYRRTTGTLGNVVDLLAS